MPLSSGRKYFEVAALALAAACSGDEPAGPGPEPGNTLTTITAGDTVAFEIPAGEQTVTLRYVADADLDQAVFFRGIDQGVSLTVTDSATASALGFGFPFPYRQDFLLQNRTAVFAVAEGTSYLLAATRSSGDERVRVRAVVHTVQRTPETVSASVAAGQAIQDETLETSADIDEYSFAGTAGQELIPFFVAPGFAGGGAALDVVDPDGLDVGGTSNFPGVTDLDLSFGLRFTLPADGTYGARVRGTESFPDSGMVPGGAYAFEIAVIDRAPEERPAAVAPGDTVDAAIARVGDVDVFTLQLATDAEVNLFLEAENTLTLAAGRLKVSLTEAGNATELATLGSPDPDTPLLENGSGRLQLPAGDYVITADGYGGFGAFRGDYRILIQPIDRAPETAAPVLAPGAAVTDAVDVPGDVDEYTLAVPADGAWNVVITTPDTVGFGDILALDVLPAGGGDPVASNPVSGELLGAGTGNTGLAPGDYLVRVDAARTTGGGYLGDYQLVAFAIDSAAEGHAGTIAVGETVAGESTPLGDVDRYTFQGADQEILSAAITDDLERMGGTIVRAADGQVVTGFAGAVERQFLIPGSGEYIVTVGPRDGGRIIGQEGPYALTLQAVPTNTEAVSSVLSVGDSIWAEPLDAVGDVDEFMLSGAADSEVQIFTRSALVGLFIDVRDGDTGALLRRIQFASPNAVARTGRLPLGPSGSVRVRVFESLGTPFQTGAYEWWSAAIDPAPETAPAALTLGELVDTESIDPIGDVDEFTFSGTAGQQVEAFVSRPAPDPTWNVALDLIDPGGNTIATKSGTNWGADPFDPLNGTGTVTLPASGTYTLLVRGNSDTDVDMGAYRVAVRAL